MNFIRILRQDCLNILHNPALVFSNTLLPLILTGTLGFVTGNSFDKNFVSSYDYYGVNMMIFPVAILAITAANAFMEERVKRGNFRISYAPVGKAELYFSKILSSWLLAFVCYGILIPFCQFVLGLNMGGGRILYFMLLLDVFSFFGCCFGTMFCCIFKSEEQANSMMQLPIFASVFLGGVLFSVHRFGGLVKTLSLFSPVKWVAACSYQMIYDGNLSLLLPVVLGLSALSLVFILICQILFKPEDYV